MPEFVAGREIIPAPPGLPQFVAGQLPPPAAPATASPGVEGVALIPLPGRDGLPGGSSSGSEWSRKDW